MAAGNRESWNALDVLSARQVCGYRRDMSEHVLVIGAGLAGCEAAWQLARHGIDVELREMKPLRRSPAHVSDRPAELVCSNSLRSMQIQNAVGLLKEEMRRLGSLIIAAADHARVPAGDALAVDRERFASYIEDALHSHRNIDFRADVMESLPREQNTIVATGPLTDSALAEDIAQVTGSDRLYFYDSIAPIVDGDSIDTTIAFEQSRYDKGDSADYLNCPMTESEYSDFYDTLLQAESVPAHDFEEPKYFQGCLPIEVVAASGKKSLLFGAMKPVGLTDPRSGKRPFAVVQLRKEDIDGRAYNLVGFQTKMKYGAQRRVLRMIPGLGDAEFLRLGAMHRNTYLDSPRLLDDHFRLRALPNVRFAGQITGVEGYVESAASGWLVATQNAFDLKMREFSLPPSEVAFGALMGHVLGLDKLHNHPHEPQNVNWGMFPRVHGVKKREQKTARVARAVAALETWAGAMELPLTSGTLSVSNHVRADHATGSV